MNSPRTTRGCRQCRDLIDALNDQIKDMQDRQKSLKQLNNTLIDSLGTPSYGNNQDATDWKSKYEREVERSCRLERQLMQLQIESQIDRKSVEKKRENMTKLNNLLMSSKFQGLENNPQLQSRRQSKRSMVGMGELSNCYGRNELVVRIVR